VLLLLLPAHSAAAADANILINTCRLTAQRYYFAYQEPMPVEQLVRALCDTKQVRRAVCERESAACTIATSVLWAMYCRSCTICTVGALAVSGTVLLIPSPHCALGDVMAVVRGQNSLCLVAGARTLRHQAGEGGWL
jgi:hypothetical protein